MPDTLLNGDLGFTFHPESANMESENTSINTDSAHFARIAPKIRLCYGFIKTDSIQPEGTAILKVGKVRGESSLILTNPVTHTSQALLYTGGNSMHAINTSIEAGFYYVSGCLIEE